MAKKRSKAALRKRVKPASHWGGHLLLCLLIVALLGAAGAAAQMLAAPSPPDSAVASTAPTAANVAGASNAVGASSSTRTLYVYGDQLRPLVEETNGVQTLNIYGPGGQIIAQVVPDGQGGQEVRYLLADHLGSTRVVLDGDGNVVARFEYGPHGETTAAGTAAAEVRYRYTGHPYDEAQGVYETPGRGYDPTLGRFLSVDPQRQDASPYVYAGNNPVGYVDPTGDIRDPFFVVSDHIASNDLPTLEGMLELFGRPRSGTHRGFTTYSDLARIASHGSALEAWRDARPILTQGEAGTGSHSRAIILTGGSTTPDHVRNIVEGMRRLDYLSGEAGGPSVSLFEDITIISSFTGVDATWSLFKSLDASGFPRVRAFVQNFHFLRNTQPPNPDPQLDYVITGDRHLAPDGSRVWGPSRIAPEGYIYRMGLESLNQREPVPPVLNWEHSPDAVLPLRPLLQTRPEPPLQPRIQAQIEPVVPPVEEFGVQ